MTRSRWRGPGLPGAGGRPAWRAAAVVLCTAVGAALGGAAAPAARAQDAWTWPLAGVGPASVVRRFDPPATRYGAGHRGVDLASSPGEPVLAAGAGRVAYAGVLAGRGVLVVVHGDLRTTYEPVTASVPVGALVGAGQPVGVLDPGHSGCPAPACLHWGLRRGEEYLDPLGLLRAGPVRLLPPGGAPPAGPPGPAAGTAAVAGPEDRTGVPPPGGAPDPDRAADPAPADGWSLRGLASAEGGLAALGLLAGLRLLRRPDPPPRAPAGTGVVPAGGGPPDELAVRRGTALEGADTGGAAPPGRAA